MAKAKARLSQKKKKNEKARVMTDSVQSDTPSSFYQDSWGTYRSHSSINTGETQLVIHDESGDSTFLIKGTFDETRLSARNILKVTTLNGEVIKVVIGIPGKDATSSYTWREIYILK